MASVPVMSSTNLNNNWFKAALGLVRTKEGLQDFIEHAMNNFQKQICIDVAMRLNVQVGTTCSDCLIINPNARKCDFYDKSDISKRTRTCSMCELIRDRIIVAHRKSGPQWKNTDSSKWGMYSWEIAKCYFSCSGYFNTHTIEEADFTALVSVIINNKELQNLVSEDLSLQDNIFEKAKNIRNALHHSSSLELSDNDLQSYLDVLITILSDQKYLASDKTAKCAIEEIQKIKNGSYKITSEDEKKILKSIDEKKQEALDALHHGMTTFENVKQTAVDELQRTFDEQSKMIHKEIEEAKNLLQHVRQQLRDEEETAIEKINKTTDGHIEQIEGKGEEYMAKLQRLDYQTEFDMVTYTMEKKNLQEELLSEYENYKMTQVCPTGGQDTLSIEDVYVEPCLVKVDKKGNEEENQSVNSYFHIFNADNARYKKISISGDAGMGKSALCQSMISTWCKAHAQCHVLGEESRQMSANETEMLQFDYLFYIPLRDVSTETEIEDMIMTLLLGKRFHAIFTKILERESEKCLIILDGLDEYRNYEKNPSKSRTVNKGMPVRGKMRNYTTLITSRPYRLEQLRLKDSDIDQHLQLRELEYKSAEKLSRSIISFLNNEYAKDKTWEQFEEDIWDQDLQHIFEIPVLLKQLICIWHDGKPIGESQCELYATMIDLMMELANKSDVEAHNKMASKQVHLPRCFKGKIQCDNHVRILCCLAELSFKTLFDEQESSLVFQHSDVELYGMSEQDINTCLKIGLLSQSNICRTASKEEKRLSFIHKTFQEYLAALYLAIDNDHIDECQEKIKDVFKSLNVIFEMSKVFVFLSGMNYEIACMLSKHINKVASNDARVQQYRQSYANYRHECGIFTRRVQSLMVECIAESPTNESTEFQVEDIFITSNTPEKNTQKLLHNSKSILKSLWMDSNAAKSYVSNFPKLCTLQKLSIISNSDMPIDNNILYDVISDSKSTLVTFECFSTLKTSELFRLPLEKFQSMLNSLSSLENIRMGNVELHPELYDCLIQFTLENRKLKRMSLAGVLAK